MMRKLVCPSTLMMRSLHQFRHVKTLAMFINFIFYFIGIIFFKIYLVLLFNYDRFFDSNLPAHKSYDYIIGKLEEPSTFGGKNCSQIYLFIHSRFRFSGSCDSWEFKGQSSSDRSWK